MDTKSRNKILRELERKLLLKSNRCKVELSLEWVRNMPDASGVYAFMDKDKIVYVGETGHLQGRMSDVRSTRNHTLRRSVGERKFSKMKGYKKASSRDRYPDHIELKLNQYLKRLYVSVLPVSLGRTEFEEYLVDKYEPIFNKKTKRIK